MDQKTPKPQRQSRIQKKNRETILEAALEVFSTYGFRGATLDQIAERAGLSKPNVLYYFGSKEEIHRSLLTGLLKTWLDPLRAMTEAEDPLQEVLSYARRKLEMSRDFPRESRLFANEILQGAPHIQDALTGDLRQLVAEKSALLQRWMDRGALRSCEPTHLIFSIWSLSQHYADFEVQIRAVLGQSRDPIAEAAIFIEEILTRLLAPQQGGNREHI